MSLTSNFLPELVVLEIEDADLSSDLARLWLQWRGPVIAPLLQLAVYVSLIMLFMVFLERVYMAAVLLGLRLRGTRPDKVYKFAPIPEDVELGSYACPKVLVQIPMYNEREVSFLLSLDSNFPASPCTRP